MIFVLTNVIYIVYDRKNENHWSLLITRYSLLGIQTPLIISNLPVLAVKGVSKELQCEEMPPSIQTQI